MSLGRAAAALLVANLTGPLELQRKRAEIQAGGGGVAGGHAGAATDMGMFQREPWGVLSVFWSRAFRGRSQGRVSVGYASASQVCPLRSWFPLIGQC